MVSPPSPPSRAQPSPRPKRHRKPPQLKRWTVSRRPKLPPPRRNLDLETGAYFTLEYSDDEKHIEPRYTGLPLSRDIETDSIPLDPPVEQHLAFVVQHPAFPIEVARLRKQRARKGEIAEVAARWQISFGAIEAFIRARPDQTKASIEVHDDLMFIEARPTVYLIHVPRPLTPRRREALLGWISQERRDLKLHGSDEWRTDRKRVRADTRLETISTWKRWNKGEGVAALADELEIPELKLRDRLREVHSYMRDLSPDKLRKPPP